MMVQAKEPIDVGHEIANILKGWRPCEGSAKDIATAVLHALERYNIDTAPTLESELRTIFAYLRQMMDERSRSF